MPTRKKRRHRKRKTYKRGGMVLKAIRTTQPDGYADSKIMPSSNNKALFDKDKFVPSVNTPWLLRFNEAKYANRILFGKYNGEPTSKSGTVHLVLNNAMEEEQANLYNQLDSELTAADKAGRAAADKAYFNSFKPFLKKYFLNPVLIVGAAAPAPAVPANGAPAVGSLGAAVPTSEEIKNAFNRETLWPKEQKMYGFYEPTTFSYILSNVFYKKIKDDTNKIIPENINELRMLMYKHRASVYDLIDDKMVEKLMDAVDNTKYSSIYKKGDTTTYNNIRYVIMWILFKIDTMFF